MLSSCVSAWMAASTGVTLKTGMERAEVHHKLGAPNSTCKDVTLKNGNGEKVKAKFVDTHLYRGKLNSFDEGAGQAITNAVTLGTAEAIMIPMTAADIAVRSAQKHRVEVSYGADSRVLKYSIDAPLQSAEIPDNPRYSVR